MGCSLVAYLPPDHMNDLCIMILDQIRINGAIYIKIHYNEYQELPLELLDKTYLCIRKNSSLLPGPVLRETLWRMEADKLITAERVFYDHIKGCRQLQLTLSARGQQVISDLRYCPPLAKGQAVDLSNDATLISPNIINMR